MVPARLVLSLALSLLGSAHAGQATSPKRLVLAVGIDSFADPHWPVLSYAAKDAADIAKFFADQARPRFSPITLISDNQKSPVTRQRIEAGLNQLTAANTSPQDIVIVYFSGHGTIDWAEGADGSLARYIVTAETDAARVAETALSYDALLKAFRRLKSRKKALILDFCHSGTGKSVLTPEILSSMAGRKGGYFPSIADDEVAGEYLLAASSWRQAAGESSKLHNGIYTHFLLKGFDQDLNGDGGVSLMEAHSYARAETAAFTKMKQTPTAKVQLEGADPIWITTAANRPKTGSAYLFSLLAGQYRVLVDGRDRGVLGKGLAIQAGRRRLTLLHPDTLQVRADGIHRFASGKEYSVRPYLARQRRQQLTLGLSFRRYLNRDLRRRFAPGIETGPALRYVRRGAVGLFDLHLSLSELSRSETLAGIRQHRRAEIISAALGWRESLGRGGESPYSWEAFASVGLGPTAQRLRFLSPETGRDSRTTVYGAVTSAALGVNLPRLHLTGGVAWQFAMTKSPFAGHRNPATSGMGQIYLGALW